MEPSGPVQACTGIALLLRAPEMCWEGSMGVKFSRKVGCF